MTYTYTASTNTLKQKAEREMPVAGDDKYRMLDGTYGTFALHQYNEDLKAYNTHLASLKEIACEPRCKEVWKDGDTVVEGRHFETRLFYHAPDDKELRAYLIKAESEDEDAMLDDIQLLLNCFDRKAGRNAVKQKYTISKKK
jgi:hypothetical protein